MSSYANPFVIIPLESTSVSQEMHLPACLDSTILAQSIDYSLPLHKFVDPSPPRLAFHIWSAFSSSFSSCSPRRSASRSKRQFPVAMIPHHHEAIFVPFSCHFSCHLIQHQKKFQFRANCCVENWENNIVDSRLFLD